MRGELIINYFCWCLPLQLTCLLPVTLNWHCPRKKNRSKKRWLMRLCLHSIFFVLGFYILTFWLKFHICSLILSWHLGRPEVTKPCAAVLLRNVVVALFKGTSFPPVFQDLFLFYMRLSYFNFGEFRWIYFFIMLVINCCLITGSRALIILSLTQDCILWLVLRGVFIRWFFFKKNIINRKRDFMSKLNNIGYFRDNPSAKIWVSSY